MLIIGCLICLKWKDVVVLIKKGQEYIGIVERVDFPNKGIICIEGEKVIVKGVIRGQKVRFAINKNRKSKAEGRLLKVIHKACEETEIPPCTHFGICGGCGYQTLPYEEQLKMKSEQVKRLLDDVIKYDYCYEGIIGSPKEWDYRNKMEFSFGDEVKDGPLVLGLHKKGSMYDIVSVSGCKIVNDDYNKILQCIQKLCDEYELSFFHKLTHIGYLRHLLIRRTEKTGEILIDLVTTSQLLKRKDSVTLCDDNMCRNKLEFDEVVFLEKMVSVLLKLDLQGKIAGILHTVNDSVADVVRSDRTDILYGQDYFYEELLGLKFKISIFSFFQTNSLGAEMLYSVVREYIGDTRDKLIFDLYSGTGTIAQILAPVARKVVGVEIVEEAVIAARDNAELNSLDNCEFIAGDVLKVIDMIEDKPDLIVIDPPRDGVNPKALEKIIAYGADRLVYISCKPTSFVRDLVMLQGSGYRVERVRCVDMFPMTGHVEVVTCLHRVKNES